MVSWRKLFNKFLFLKSASPPSREGRILFFIFIPWNTRFQSPFSFTIHLHSLIRVSRRDKKKHFEIQITRGYSARGTRCPPTARLVVHFANTPLSSILTGTSEASHCCDVWSVTPSFLVSKARIRVFLAPHRTRESTAAQLARRQSTSRRPLLFLLNFLLIKISVLFHSVFTVLFSFPSQYLFTIGLWFNI